MADGSAQQGSSPAPVRRTANRPGMVPLSEFRKPPPPPPRTSTNWRNVIVGTVVVLLIVLAAGVAIASEQGSASAIWGQTKCLDVRKGC